MVLLRWLALVLLASCRRSAALAGSTHSEVANVIGRLPRAQRGRVLINSEGATDDLYGSEDVTDLQLSGIQEAQASLAADNGRLREELALWRQTAQEVAAREERVVALIEQKRPPPQQPQEQPQAGSSALSLMASAVSSAYSRAATAAHLATQHVNKNVQPYLYMKASEGVQLRPSAVLLLFFGINAVGFLVWTLSAALHGKTVQKDRPAVASTSPQEAASSARSFVEPVLRHLGLGKFVLEVSEIQVGNWQSMDKCTSVVLEAGGREMRAQAVGPVADSLLRFRGTLEVPVCQKDAAGKCTFWVLSDAQLARVDISNQDLLGLLRQRHGEYFSFDLSTDVSRSWPARLLDGSSRNRNRDQRPHLAMRIRDISGLQAEDGKRSRVPW